MMEKMFGPYQQMSEEDLQIGRQLEDRLQPSFNENLGTSNMNQFNVNQNVSPNVRGELAFGTIDDAINQQMMDRGIAKGDITLSDGIGTDNMTCIIIDFDKDLGQHKEYDPKGTMSNYTDVDKKI